MSTTSIWKTYVETSKCLKVEYRKVICYRDSEVCFVARAAESRGTVADQLVQTFPTHKQSIVSLP